MDKPKQPEQYRIKLRRYNLLRALSITERGITHLERAEMDALAAELNAAELALK